MSNEAKVVAAVASGYLLGQTKKMKLAITIGSMLAGQRVATSPRGLLKQGQELVESNPELAKIQDQIRDKLFEAAKAAAVATLSSRLEMFSDSLRTRTDDLRGLAELEAPSDESEEAEEPEEGEEEPEEPEEGEEGEEEPEAEAAEEEEEPEEEPEPKPAKKAAAAKKTTAKKSTAKKAPAKKAQAGGSAAKKSASTAKKSSSRSSRSRSSQ